MNLSLLAGTFLVICLVGLELLIQKSSDAVNSMFYISRSTQVMYVMLPPQLEFTLYCTGVKEVYRAVVRCG